MNQDLKIIKNKYGEKMMHLCREMFPTILETEGALSKILLEKFEPSRFIYDDIVKYKLIDDFKNYIYNIYDLSSEEEIQIEKTPSELLEEAGYILYECKTEEDIQSFKKYYKKGEELCTFKGNRLNRCHVYFAVKKEVDNIKREDFENPKRQDLYGTSVISIQFTKDPSHILSIKNRYNHTVPNPDATFSNDLDNIISGLTDSFAVHYGMKQRFKVDDFEIPGYVMANDGKYYKYNKEIGNVYYCPDNIIIDNFEVKKFPKEKYIVLDYFILDLKTGEITLYDDCITDSFPDTIEDCGKPAVYNEGDYKKIVFTKEGKEPSIIVLDKLNNIVGLENKNVIEIKPGFLRENERLEKLSLPNVSVIGDYFLFRNENLKMLSLPQARIIDRCFLASNAELNQLDIPQVICIGNNFLDSNKNIENMRLPNVEYIGNHFLRNNTELQEIELPKVIKIGSRFLNYNNKLEKIDLPNLEIIFNDFLSNNRILKEINIPKVKEIGKYFLFSNKKMKEIELPNVIKIGDEFMCNNEDLEKITLPSKDVISHPFLPHNNRSIEIHIVGENTEDITINEGGNNENIKSK